MYGALTLSIIYTLYTLAGRRYRLKASLPLVAVHLQGYRTLLKGLTWVRFIAVSIHYVLMRMTLIHSLTLLSGQL